MIPFGSGRVIKTNHETKTEGETPKQRKTRVGVVKLQRTQPALRAFSCKQGSWPDEAAAAAAQAPTLTRSHSGHRRTL